MWRPIGLVCSSVPRCTKGLMPQGTFPERLGNLSLVFHPLFAHNILSRRCGSSALVGQGGRTASHPRATRVQIFHVIQDVPHHLQIPACSVVRNGGVAELTNRPPCIEKVHRERKPISEMMHLDVCRTSCVSTRQAKHHLSVLSTRLAFPSRRISQRACASIYADPRHVRTHCTVQGFFFSSSFDT